MKLSIAIAFACILLIGCQNVEKPVAPENLIDRETMIQILSDAYVGNAARSINNRLLRTENIQLDSVLYRKYKIDSAQFAASNAYYVSDLNGYAEMFGDIEKELKKRKVVVDTLIAQEARALKRRKDSIRRQDSIDGKPLSKINTPKNSNKPSLVDPVQEE